MFYFFVIASCLLVRQTTLCEQTGENLPPFLLYNDDKQNCLKGVSLAENDSFKNITPPITGNGVWAFDYDYANQYIYFQNNDPPYIARQKIKTENKEIIIDKGTEDIFSLAVDSLNQNIYWTNGKKNVLMVASLKNPKNMKELHKDLLYPSTILLDTINGKLYWMNQDPSSPNTKMLESSSMDGSDRKITRRGFVRVFSLAIDHASNTIFWADFGINMIRSASLLNPDGEKKDIVEGAFNWSLKDMALYDNHLYFSTFFQTKTIFRTNLDGQNKTKVLAGETFSRIKIFDPSNYNGSSVCSNLNCPQLCLMRTPQEGVCVCSDGYKGSLCQTKVTDDPSTGQDDNYLFARNCPNNMIRCINEQKCLRVEQFCDGKIDCVNSYDEGEFCKNTTCDTECSWKCRSTPIGSKCICKEGYKLVQNTKCIKDVQCLNPDKCDHICTLKNRREQCSCQNGYTLINGTTCKANNDPIDESASILINDGSTLKKIDLRTTKTLQTYSKNGSFFGSMAVDQTNQNICFFQTENYEPVSLQCVDMKNILPSKNYSLPINIQQSFNSIITKDWTSGNWYVCFSEMVYVCSSNFEHCAIINDTIKRPTAISLDPGKGYLFLLHWGYYSGYGIRRTSFDGKQVKVLIEEGLSEPVSLTLDYPREHIYWMDNDIQRITRMDYNGQNIKILKTGTPLRDIASITLFENHIYAASKTGVIKMNLKNGEDYQELKLGNGIWENLILHRQRQPIDDRPYPCLKNNGGCEYICINVLGKKTITPKCLCPEGQKMNELNKCIWIHVSSPFIVYGTSNIIRGLPLKENLTISSNHDPLIPVIGLEQSSEFDYDSVSQFFYFTAVSFIGGQRLDGSARYLVTTGGSLRLTTVDSYGRNIYYVDGSTGIFVVAMYNPDLKKLLHKVECTALVLNPAKGKMYFISVMGQRHQRRKIETSSMDGSGRKDLIERMNDASELAMDPLKNRLYIHQYQADTLKYIDFDESNDLKVAFVSFGTNSLLQMSYFDNYIIWRNQSTYEKLDLNNNQSTPIGLPNEYWRDVRAFNNFTEFVSPCFNMSCNHNELCLMKDEGKARCVSVHQTEAKTCADGSNGELCEDQDDPQMNGQCKNDEFRCTDDGRCLPLRLKCDNVTDCADESDEDRCGIDENTRIHGTGCEEGHFKCKDDGKCLPLRLKCDNVTDCADESDEERCGIDENTQIHGTRCEGDHFKCKDDLKCIPVSLKCDDIVDCSDESDEEGCVPREYGYTYTTRCQKSHFKCKEDGKCLPLSLKCDKVVDCSDESDENSCGQAEPSYGNTYGNTYSPTKY